MKLRSPNSRKSSPQKEMVLGSKALNGKSRLELPALKRVYRSRSLPCLEYIRKFVCRCLDLVEHLCAFTALNYHYQHRFFAGPELVMCVGKPTGELPLVEPSRNPVSWVGTGNQADMIMQPIRAIDQRSPFGHSGKSASAVRTVIGVALQRSTPVAGPISAKTVAETRSGSEEYSSLAGEGKPKLALLENIGRRGDPLSALDQLRNFVGKFFDLLSSLARTPYWEPNYHTNERILRPDLIVDVNENADGSPKARTWRRVQRHMKRFAIGSINYRRVPSEANENLPAVFARVGVPLHRKALFLSSILMQTVAERRRKGEKSHFRTGVIG